MILQSSNANEVCLSVLPVIDHPYLASHRFTDCMALCCNCFKAALKKSHRITYRSGRINQYLYREGEILAFFHGLHKLHALHVGVVSCRDAPINWLKFEVRV